jgi:hypothetical protein
MSQEKRKTGARGPSPILICKASKEVPCRSDNVVVCDVCPAVPLQLSRVRAAATCERSISVSNVSYEISMNTAAILVYYLWDNPNVLCAVASHQLMRVEQVRGTAVATTIRLQAR